MNTIKIYKCQQVALLEYPTQSGTKLTKEKKPTIKQNPPNFRVVY